MANKEPNFLQRFFGAYEDEELSSLDLEELEGSALRRRLSLSWLALLPLLAVYAAGARLAAESGVATRNTSELFCGQLLRLFGDFADSAGLIILAVITGAALLRAVSLRWPMGEGVLWSVLEGAGIGLLMGPLLLFFVGLFPAYLSSAELVADAGSPAASRVRAGCRRCGLGGAPVSLDCLFCAARLGSRTFRISWGLTQDSKDPRRGLRLRPILVSLCRLPLAGRRGLDGCRWRRVRARFLRVAHCCRCFTGNHCAISGPGRGCMGACDLQRWASFGRGARRLSDGEQR